MQNIKIKLANPDLNTKDVIFGFTPHRKNLFVNAAFMNHAEKRVETKSIKLTAKDAQEILDKHIQEKNPFARFTT